MRYAHLIDMHIIIIIPCKQLEILISLPSLLLCHWREQISLLSFSTENVNTTPQVYCIVPPCIILHHQYIIAVVLTFFAVKITPSFCTSHNNFRSWSHWMFVSRCSLLFHSRCCSWFAHQFWPRQGQHIITRLMLPMRTAQCSVLHVAPTIIIRTISSPLHFTAFFWYTNCFVPSIMIVVLSASNTSHGDFSFLPRSRLLISSYCVVQLCGCCTAEVIGADGKNILNDSHSKFRFLCTGTRWRCSGFPPQTHWLYSDASKET